MEVALDSRSARSQSADVSVSKDKKMAKQNSLPFNLPYIRTDVNFVPMVLD